MVRTGVSKLVKYSFPQTSIEAVDCSAADVNVLARSRWISVSTFIARRFARPSVAADVPMPKPILHAIPEFLAPANAVEAVIEYVIDMLLQFRLLISRAPQELGVQAPRVRQNKRTGVCVRIGIQSLDRIPLREPPNLRIIQPYTQLQ